ncbi:UDP-glucose/GDP-mannose dehydrogenase family protein [Candidatus Dojkabacteria bacterium]|nr:UDP-glucose/GDP-mannose dehydrogenase family protein [Candidatus Dojkabacteria bacterium]
MENLNKKDIITVVGTGYVGLTLAVACANAGYKVYCLDVDENKINTIKSGRSHFYEVGLDDFVRNAVDSGNLIPTTSYEQAIPNSSIVFSCVGTPDLPDGSPNMEFIYGAVEETIKNANNGLIYVQKSTVPVGTGGKLLAYITEKQPDLRVSYVSNPEFTRESSAMYDTLNTDRVVVGGSDQEALDRVVDIFKTIDDFAKDFDIGKVSRYATLYKGKSSDVTSIDFLSRVLKTSLESAELIKVTANAFLALKISFANSIALVCDKAGADINEVMDGIGLDSRIERSFLYAGRGWGGGCFPKDVSGLITVARGLGIDLPIMNSAVEVNNYMTEHIDKKIEEYFGSISGKKLAFLGLAFKPGTSDIRKSPAIRLANLLDDRGAQILAYDPEAMSNSRDSLNQGITLVDNLSDVFVGAEAVVISTAWPEFVEFDYQDIKNVLVGKLIVDCENRLDKDKVKSLGFDYIGVGRS